LYNTHKNGLKFLKILLIYRKFKMQIRVYYEDTDTGGVVYHSNYLNYCERARSEAFYAKGITPVLEGGHFVARRVVGDFFSSAKLGDMLEVRSELLRMKAASFTLKQGVYRGEEKIFELEILLAYITFEGKPQKIDATTKELLLSLF
jgi:acyl-CoA thioester hydrolase